MLVSSVLFLKTGTNLKSNDSNRPDATGRLQLADIS